MIRRRRAAAATAILAILAGAMWGGPSLQAKGRQSGLEGAGGPGVAHYPGGVAIKGHRVPSARLYRLGIPSGEPTVGVTNEGNVFTVAIQTNTRVDVMRSKNEGGTWEIVSPKFPNGRNAQLLSFDPYIWVDDYEGVDRIFTIDLTVACAYLSFSDDEGKSWLTNPLSCGRPVNDHQTLFSGPASISPTVSYPHVVYYCWNDIGSSSCSKSLDGGISFVPTGSPAFGGIDPDAEDPSVDPEVPPTVGSNCGGLHGHGHVGPDGTVFLPKGHCGQPWLAISRDEGATWERVQVADNGIAFHEASVATDRKGNVYYVYHSKDRLPYLVVSRDEGKTWTKPMMVGAPKVNETNLPSIDVGGVGKVAIAYMGTTNSPGQPFPRAPGTSTNPDCAVAQLPCPPPEEYAKTTWSGYMTLSANVFADNPLFYSVTVNDPKDPLKRGTCNEGRLGRCGNTILDFIDVTIAPDGQVWSSWVDACTLACAEPKSEQDGGSEGIIGRLMGIRLR